jgi:hypothetical protein
MRSYLQQGPVDNHKVADDIDGEGVVQLASRTDLRDRADLHPTSIVYALVERILLLTGLPGEGGTCIDGRLSMIHNYV